MSAPVPWRPLIAGFGAVVGSVALLILGLRLGAEVVVAAGVYLVGAALVARHRRSGDLGRANGVTLVRLIGLSVVSAVTAGLAAGRGGAAAIGLIVAVSVGCLVLDGVDGRLARAYGEVSDFGARFDMEVDAALLMVLCLAVGLQGSVGWWVLAIGLLRYVYWLCSLRVARLRLPVPPRLWRKVTAVVQGAALLCCLALGELRLGPAWLPQAVAAVALAPLLWSFLTVTVWQLRQPLPTRSSSSAVPTARS